jgi:hypothetical protein
MYKPLSSAIPFIIAFFEGMAGAAPRVLIYSMRRILSYPIYPDNPASPLCPPSLFAKWAVGVRSIECQALPGPEARALRAKTIRHTSLLGLGGQAVLSRRTWSFRCRGARWARLILRKHGGSPDKILLPPMLFPRNALASEPQDCFSRKENRKSQGGQERAPLSQLSPKLERYPGSAQAGSLFGFSLTAMLQNFSAPSTPGGKSGSPSLSGRGIRGNQTAPPAGCLFGLPFRGRFRSRPGPPAAGGRRPSR